MTGAPSRYLTLGLFPTARGFGWIAFEGPFAPYDWDLVTVQKDKNRKCLEKAGALLDRLKPETLVLEAFDKQSSIRSERIRKLCLAVVTLAAEKGIDVALFTRGEVQACFAGVGARTREEIAESVALMVPALKPRLPKRRAPGDGEDKRLSLFSAAALVLTHYHYGTTRLFEDLSRDG